MKSKRFYFPLLASVMLVAMMVVSLTACKDNIDNNVPINPDDNTAAILDGAQDIFNGKLYYVLNANNLSDYRIPVASLRPLDITFLDQSENYGLSQEEVDGVRYIVPHMKKDDAPRFEFLRLRVAPKDSPENVRHLLLVFVKPVPRTRAATEGGWESEYSKRIGQTTYPWQTLSHSQKTLFLSDSINNLDMLSRADGKSFNFDNFFLVNTSSTQSVALTFECESMEQASSNWQEQVGASINITAGKIKNKGVSINAAFTESVTHEEMSMNSFEYCLLINREQQAILKMHMDNFEKDNNSIKTLADNFKVLSYITDDTFMEDLYEESAFGSNFTAGKMFEKWGTDVITQGAFGGLYANLYGRTQNVYETSTFWDLMISGGYEKGKDNDNNNNNNNSGGNGQSGTSTTQNENPWLKIFYEKQKDQDVDGTINYSEGEEHYSEASCAFSVEVKLGSEAESSHDDWVSGLNNKDKWALISYRTDPKDSKTNFLYPIEQVAQNLLDGYKAVWDDIQLDDNTQNVLDRVQKRIDMLKEDREDYIIENGFTPIVDRGRIVLADLMMVKGENNQPEGEPRPKIMYCDHDQKYRIYLPMMLNYKNVDEKYKKPITPTPKQMGYAMETSQECYCAVKDGTDQLWYYALDYEKNTTGIVNVIFHNEEKEFYVRRGNHAADDMKGTANYVMLRLYTDQVPNADPMKKITAVGLCDNDSRWNERPGGILASTGGSELAGAYTTPEVYVPWETFWTAGTPKSTDGSKTGWKDMTYYGNVKDYIWNEGGSVGHEWEFGPVISSKTLNISRLCKKTITLPQKWTKEKLYSR